MKIGEILKKERNSRNLKQEEVAEKLNIAVNTYSQYENEKRNINIKTLIELADLYNVSLDYLTGRYEKK